MPPTKGSQFLKDARKKEFLTHKTVKPASRHEGKMRFQKQPAEMLPQIF